MINFQTKIIFCCDKCKKGFAGFENGSFSYSFDEPYPNNLSENEGIFVRGFMELIKSQWNERETWPKDFICKECSDIQANISSY